MTHARRAHKSSVNIDATKFGEITINGKPYDSDMTIYWDGKLKYRGKQHLIEMGEFAKLLMSSPEIVVIGLGQSGGITVAPEVVQWAKNKHVDLYMEVTPRAAKLFNAFANQGKKVIGVFHVTC